MKISEHQNTKIVATVGPASNSFEVLLDLVKAGVNVFRLNFSHGAHEDHKKVIDHICHINERYNLYIGILADLQGPKIRIGDVKGGFKKIKKDDIIYFVNQSGELGEDTFHLSYENFPNDVKPGERILMDDGKVVCEVLETDGAEKVTLKVIFGSVLASRKGVNLPDTKISLPSLTEKDLHDLDFILTQPAINWIALSFVRRVRDVKDLKSRIARAKHPAKVISKIEKPEAIKKLDKIINQSDGIMIARGDLGIEVPMERLPLLQKSIITKCIQKAKPVIVATQLMDSMVTNPSPTRAEITDVANAVLDGTDAVMLSAESAVGDHPVTVVEAMNKIIEEAERHFRLSDKRPKASSKSATYLSDVVCISAGKTAEDIGAKGIVGLTSSGYTAFKISSYRPNAEIYVFSDRDHTLATINLAWGVIPFYYDRFTSTDETIVDVITILKVRGYLKVGDFVVNTGAMPLHKRYRTNFLKITLVD